MLSGRWQLTVLVPCFNEGARIEATVRRLLAWAEAQPGALIELLLIDDGSTDDTAPRLERLVQTETEAGAGRLRVLALAQNQGKGVALRAGMAAARGARVVFLDADLAVEPEAIPEALARLDAGADLVAGCRNIEGARILRPQGPVRRTLGRIYLRLSRFVLGLRTPDVTCGFKAFRREVGQAVFRRSRCRRWGIDAELLRIAEGEGLSIQLLAVTWRHGSGSAVRPLRDVCGAFWELSGVRWRAWTGVYTRGEPPRAESSAVSSLAPGACPVAPGVDHPGATAPRPGD